MSEIMVIGARGIPNIQGGLEKHAEALFPRFAENGYDVELVGLKRYMAENSYKGIRLTGLPTLEFLNTDKLVYHLVAVPYVLWQRPKLLHLQGLNAALFLWLYRLCGLKVVLRYGSADYDYGKWGSLSSAILKLCEYQLRFAHHVITVSENYRARLQGKHGLRRITVVPNGTERIPVEGDADVILNSYGLGDRPFILSVGRVTPEKDYATLLAAFQRLNRTDITLVVAGGSGDANYSKQYLAMNSDHIRFLGPIPRSELGALFDRCSLYVCSSIHEGQSNAVLEALASGKPVIASEIPANMELGLPRATYFTPGDDDALAEKISNALMTPEPFTFDAQDLPDWNDVFERTALVYSSVVPNLKVRKCAAPSVT